METEISAAFTLTSIDFDPDEITSLVKIVPTKMWRLGDLISQRGTIQYTHNGWSIKSELEASEGLEEHIKFILNKLQPSWQSLVELGTEFNSEISCVIYTNPEQIPAIHFSKEIIKKINELNAEIDVDLYVLSDEDD